MFYGNALAFPICNGMNLNKIQGADVGGKRVLVRADFNVEIKNGDVMEKFKIAAAKGTLEYLLARGAKVALLSHLGRPSGKDDKKFSLLQISDDLERILGIKIKFIDECTGEKVAIGLSSLVSGEVLLLENVRFCEGDEANDPEFAKKLAGNFDIFVNDAFSVCHRDHASVTGVVKILPSYAGFQLQREVETLTKAMENPEKPSVAIIGGAKIETKLPLIEKFQQNYGAILIGGMIANEAIDRKLKFRGDVVLPVDFAVGRLDIGPETIKKFKEIILYAKTIVWNGPMGKFEESPYDTGTKEILRAVLDSGAYSIMGGGESVQILEESNVMDKISFVSTGGGAMLEFLSGNKMPGIEALLKGD